MEPGAAYPDLQITHEFQRRGRVSPRLDTTYAASYRVDRQLFGRAARQGDPGSAQMFCSAEDDLFLRHAKTLRRFWRVIGPKKLIRLAQNRAERLARFNRKQVLKADDWMDQSLPF